MADSSRCQDHETFEKPWAILCPWRELSDFLDCNQSLGHTRDPEPVDLSRDTREEQI